MYVIYVLHPNYLGIGLVPQMHVGIQEKKIGVHGNRESSIKKGRVKNMRLHGSNKASWSLIYLD
jgi:hypothetical protein